MRAARHVAVRGILAAVLVVTAVAGCSRGDDGSKDSQRDARTGGRVTVSGDDRIARSLTWEMPPVVLREGEREAALSKAAAALAAGRLYQDSGSAIPLYTAVLRDAPDDARAQAGLHRALEGLLADGRRDLSAAGEDAAALQSAHLVAAVARTTAPKDVAVQDYLRQVDVADQLWELNRLAEQDLRAGRLGESGGQGALPKLRAALRLQPGQPRAMQGLAAVESGLIRRAEHAAQRENFAVASRWLAVAAGVRHAPDTIADARARIDAMRNARIAQWHDEGMQALSQGGGITTARGKLAQMLRIARPADANVAELRARIEQVAHYGLFRPGQHFTDGLKFGARGPEMVVVPHGGFRMGAADDDEEAGDISRPAHNVHFARGFAMSVAEVTVDQFRDFVRATGYRPTASRRGNALVYDERSGNFVRRGGVDWQSAYDGSPAEGALPVVFVSAHDAQSYAEWLAAQSGAHYRLPSEAEFEYALRAGGSGRYPWGDGAPTPGIGNLTGGRDTSPGGRHWANAFSGYGDGFWGPAPVERFLANAYGLHDLAGNVSEWVSDCWHDGYRRAPDDGAAWVNPGCRTSVVRGGSWASSPLQARSAWRAPLDVEATTARVGFRVARDI